MMRTSQRAPSSRIAAAIAARSSATVRCAVTSQPMAESFWAIQALFVSTVWPRTSSSPIERMIAFLDLAVLSVEASAKRNESALSGRRADGGGDAVDHAHQAPLLVRIDLAT